MSKLAILGGNSEVKSNLAFYQSVGQREIDQVKRVLDSGCLSGYVGAWGEAFNGGAIVQEFERVFKETFASKYAIAVNSATSGLFAAIGAVGVGPGDEVIVPPYTMSATAMAPIVYGGIPVFCDIEDETFCLDPIAVKKQINKKTKAIIAVNLFGHPAKLAELRQIADEHGIYLIEDNAQSPFGREGSKYTGTIGHIGVFSLNYHKHIHTGEGGVCLTDDEQLALKLSLIRNHGENAAIPAGLTDLTNMVGFNYRMTELSAAVGLAQLEDASKHVDCREEQAKQLTAATIGLAGLTPPVERKNCRHVYYVWALRYDKKAMGISRDTFSKALMAEGFPNYQGYVKPLYLLPIFQQKIAIGSEGFPFNLTKREYEAGLCPVVERMYDEELLWFPNCSYAVSDETTKQFCNALQKVWQGKEELKELEKNSAPSLSLSGKST